MLEKQSEQAKHKQIIYSLSTVSANNATMIQALVGFLSGHTTKTEVVNQLKSIATPDVEKVVKAVEKLEKCLQNKEIDWSPVIAGFSSLEEQLKAIPKELPESPEQIEVDFTATNLILGAIETAVKGIQLVVPAPLVSVKVPKSQIVVEQTNLAEIKTPLLDILDVIKLIQIPEPILTDLSIVEELLTKVNEQLKKIEKKNFGGGGGGGSAFPYAGVDGLSRQVILTSAGEVPVYLNAAVTVTYPFVDNETPGGVKNGSNVTFTTFYNYKPGTTKLFVNGVRQREGVGFDYLEAGTNQLTLSIAPIVSDILLIDYSKA